MGDGSSDSPLDVIAHSKSYKETVIRLYCKLDEPEILSHHDLIVSRFAVPTTRSDDRDSCDFAAPRVKCPRARIKWTDDGVQAYSLCVSPILTRLRSTWLNPSSEASTSVLLQSTNAILNLCAMSTNPYSNMSMPKKHHIIRKPKHILISERRLRRSFKRLKKTTCTSPQFSNIQENHRKLKLTHKRLIRSNYKQEEKFRDSLLENINSSNSTSTFRQLKRLRAADIRKINRLKVDSEVYLDGRVPDGIFTSIHNLKMEPEKDDYEDEDDTDFQVEYQLILDICKSGRRIPSISKEDAFKILNSLKKTVNDFFSITSLHYLFARASGVDHFFFLLNTIIRNINLAGIEELNKIYACVLFKGHGKSREDARSYRTISTCPLIAKALDFYVRDLCCNDWNKVTAPTQFQGPRMSHDLACVLLTETVQFSLHVSKKPVFALFLDARSAFDRILKKILIRNMYLAGTDDHRLIYFDNRLSNRQTYVDFDKQVMGPINDCRGLEQGCCYSSDAYKLYNNEQANTAQCSNLGVNIYDQCISCISPADDAVLLSCSLVNLKLLLHLTVVYCKKYDVELVADKTHLVAFTSGHVDEETELAMHSLPIMLNEKRLSFSDEATHLGVLRSASTSNMPHLMSRLSAHRKVLFSLLPAGLARRHNANPYAGLKIESMYALPVLMSGISTLVLKKSEYNVVMRHHKDSLKRIMKLPADAPDCSVFSLA